MKTIVIVYAFSWLSLLVVYLISMYENRKSKKMSKSLKAFLNSQKSRRDKILDKLLYVILIVFAPLVVFVVPYVVVKHIKTKMEARIREEEKEKSEREYERHKTECIENYSKWASGKNNCCGKDHICLAQSLMVLVKQQKYDEFLNLLNKTSLPSGMKLGMKEWHAELLPADKIKIVNELSAQKGENGTTLAFVGDGINDAPVLARADVGIAMGGLGSDAAIEAADVVLMDDHPSKVATVVGIARRTLRIAGENVALAIGVKVAVLLLAVVGLATMWMAVFADVGVTVLAVLNAMRALRS